MNPTAENYFSKEINQEYLSTSQFKEFAGTMGMRGCEARAMAGLRGEYEREITPSLLVGSYVDAHFNSCLDIFKAQNPKILRKNGALRTKYEKANDIISRIEQDNYFMKYMSGKKQEIMTAEFFGTKWKCKIDSLTEHCITDLKIMKSLRESFWVKDYGKMSFVHYWGFDIQGAIYQKITEGNINKKLPFFIAGASKEKVTDIEIIGFTQKDLDDSMSIVESNVKRILDLKSLKIKPDRCEDCSYCRETKVLKEPIHYSELIF